MNYFKIIDNLPTYDLLSELNQMIDTSTINFCNNTSQICINTISGKEDDYIFGTGSLSKNWNNEVKYKINNVTKSFVPKKKIIYKEEDFNIICSQFKETLFESVYNELNSRYKLGRIRIMKSKSKTCLSWHFDVAPRLHYPLKTQEGCLMIIEDEVKFLEPYKWWLTNTLKYHTAINASAEDRIHLVATILEEY
jgi:hypothetical protein